MATLDGLLGGLAGAPVLVLGLTYREGVKELAYSRAIPLIAALAAAGAEVWAWDPLLDAAEIGGARRPPLDVGHRGPLPGGRHPDRRPPLRRPRPGLVPGAPRRLRRPEQPARARPAGGRGLRRRRRPGRDAPPARRVAPPAWTTRAHRQRRRNAAPAHQGSRAAAGAARPARRGVRRHGPALGRGDGRDVLRGARPSAARPRPRRGRRGARRADRPDARRARADPGGGAARRRPRLRRHELDPGRRARRGEARDPGRARRGRPAELRPAHARGDQPGRGRPPGDMVLRADADRRGEPRAPRGSPAASSRSAT